MARTELERTVQPSLLDRLTDEEPESRADPALSREESVRRFRDGVQRDLDWLLNTRRTMEPAPAGLPELCRSVYDFGLPDTTALAPGTREGKERLVESMRQTITTFDPRLADLRLRLVTAEQVEAPQVRFVLEALLRMDPRAEQVAFDAIFEIASGEYLVQPPGRRDGAPGA